MKAIAVKEPGNPENLVLEESPEPVLRPGEVLVDIKAAALNRADLLQRRGFYPPPKGETHIMGLECAGTTSSGDRVMALLPGGGYAERVAVPEPMLIPIPDGLSFVEAAAIPEAFLTAREALFTLGRTQKESTVLIHASAGGIGSAAVQLAKRAGARVVATAGSDEKLEKVRALGADVLVNYRSQNFADVVREVTEGRGADVVLDFIGGAYWNQHAQCLGVGGRVVVIGVLGGMTAEVNFAQLLQRRFQILGLVMRSRPLTDKIAFTKAFIEESLPLFATGALRPIVDRVFPLADAGKAQAYMETNANFGKIVLEV